MLSKLLAATILADPAEAVKVQQRVQQRALARITTKATRVDQSCMGAVNRMASCDDEIAWAKYGGGNEWTDPGFPADSSSLYWHSTTNEMPGRYDKEVTGWITAREWVKDAKSASPEDQDPNSNPKGLPYLWGREGVRPYGTKQGRLGDCWFLAACSSLAEYPERIKRIFTNAKYDANGVFNLNFHELDETVSVTVDD